MKANPSSNKLIIYISRNSGMTASQLAHIFKVKWGTLSSRLCKMERLGLIRKVKSVGACANVPTWRYYPTK